MKNTHYQVDWPLVDITINSQERLSVGYRKASKSKRKR